jgi:hypothetical protein
VAEADRQKEAPHHLLSPRPCAEAERSLIKWTGTEGCIRPGNAPDLYPRQGPAHNFSSKASPGWCINQFYRELCAGYTKKTAPDTAGTKRGRKEQSTEPAEPRGTLGKLQPGVVKKGGNVCIVWEETSRRAPLVPDGTHSPRRYPAMSGLLERS